MSTLVVAGTTASPGIDTVYNSLNDNISGGERQKLAIIRLLLSNSDIWILDEPTYSLDKQSHIKFYSILNERKNQHITIIISHDEPLEYDGIIKLSSYIVTEHENYDGVNGENEGKIAERH